MVPTFNPRAIHLRILVQKLKQIKQSGWAPKYSLLGRNLTFKIKTLLG
jgi:hypothetical protein